MTDQDERPAVDGGWGMPHIPDGRSASPEQLAQEAFGRGDELFQIDLVVSVYQGHIGAGSSATRVVRPAQGDVLGAIERTGWQLEHVSTAFVATGSSATKATVTNFGETEAATHGQLVGLYVFRRRA